MTKHTPAPWKMQDSARPYFNCGEDGCSFGPITYAGSVSQMIADAEFAVHAANSNDELLEVLKAIQTIWRIGECE